MALERGLNLTESGVESADSSPGSCLSHEPQETLGNKPPSVFCFRSHRHTVQSKPAVKPSPDLRHLSFTERTGILRNFQEIPGSHRVRMM